MSDHDCPDCHMKPGSDTARTAGCTCPQWDNAHGHTDRTITVEGCPVHWPDN